jgi:tRNA U54 and U55 pseudouridine synthase Pus10
MKSKKSTKENTENKGFFKKVLDNITEGATVVSEKVKEASAKAYVAGSEIASETSEKIHEFTEKQALHKEEKNINDKQEDLKYMFGKLTLEHYLKNDSLHKSFLTTKAVGDIVENFKANQKRLKAIAKELKTLEEH